MKLTFLKKVLFCMLAIFSIYNSGSLLAQCIGDPLNPYYFCNSISRSTLNKYLNKAAAYSYVTEDTYCTSPEFDEDIEMLNRLQPKWLGRVAGQWWDCGSNDPNEFSNAEIIADRIHTEVNEYIILQAGIYENVNPALSATGDWNVQIPNYVLTEFGQPTTPTQFFEHDLITYNSYSNIPDLSKLQARMWFYYRATKYIDAGYEALHFGIFNIMNDNDPRNEHWNNLLVKIRAYATTHARRGIVLTDAHVEQCMSGNDKPYLFDAAMSQIKFLFDYLSVTMEPDEYGVPISNPANPFFDNKDRQVKINENACTIYAEQYGGNTAQAWGWSYSDSHPLPTLIEFDNGGANVFDCEGLKTIDGFQCNIDDDPELETPEYLTWGFGGESVWFPLQSDGYRNYFNTYAHSTIKEISPDLFLRMNLRMPYTYSGAPWPGIIYNAKIEEFNDESTIKWIWTNQDDIDLCTKTTLFNEFTHGITGWNTTDHIRTTADVNGDYKQDIVGFGNSHVIVSTSNGSGFNTPSNWYINDFSKNFGWSVSNHVRKMGDINGDSKYDIIGFDDNGVKVAKSNGTGFSTAYYAFSFWGNLDGWNNTQHIRDIGDFNGDGKTDIIGFWDASVKVRVSNGNNFVLVTPGHSDTWATEFCYNNGWRVDKHLIRLGDMNGDGKTDIVGFKDDGVYVGLSNGTSFDVSIWITNELCYNKGWTLSSTKRYLADVNGDGMDDIVGFGYWGVLVAISTGTGFETPQYWIYDFGTDALSGGWNNADHTRRVADINGDGMFDIVGFGNSKTVVSLSTGNSFSGIETINDFGFPAYTNTNDPRLLADVDNDGKDEIIAFGETNVYTYNCGTSSSTFKEQADLPNSKRPPFIIYPNPTENILTIEFEIISSGVIQIVSSIGSDIIEPIVVTNTKRTPITINDLPPGIYFVIFKGNDNTNFTQKLTVIK